MKRIRKLGAFILLASIVCLPGCWDSKDIETLDIPLAAGYDLVEVAGTDQKQMEIYAVIPVFYKDTPQKHIIDITSGSLVGETRSMRLDHLGEELNLGSFQVAVLSSTLAEEGARDAIEIINRTPQVKKTVNLAVAEGDINDLFQVVPENYPNVGIYMNTLMDSAFHQLFIPESTIHTFSISMYTPGWHPVAPMLKAQEDKIYINGYAIFDEDKLAHTITLPEARILRLLRNRCSCENWSYSFIYKENIPLSATVEMINKARIKVERSDHGYRFEVDIKSSGSLIEFISSQDYKTLDSKILKGENLLKSKELLRALEKGYEEYIKQEITSLIEKAQTNFRMDIFNWVRFAQAKWRRELEDVDWDKYFSQSEVILNVKADIEYIGEQT